MLEEEMQQIGGQDEDEDTAACTSQLQDLLDRECQAQVCQCLSSPDMHTQNSTPLSSVTSTSVHPPCLTACMNRSAQAERRMHMPLLV